MATVVWQQLGGGTKEVPGEPRGKWTASAKPCGRQARTGRRVILAEEERVYTSQRKKKEERTLT